MINFDWPTFSVRSNEPKYTEDGYQQVERDEIGHKLCSFQNHEGIRQTLRSTEHYKFRYLMLAYMDQSRWRV